MAELDISATTTTSLDSAALEFAVNPQSLDVSNDKETKWTFTEATKNIGYYKQIPELKKAIDALAMWTTGKGFIPNSINDAPILDKIRGWGEDSFDTVMKNMIIMKKVVGDSFAEIIRNDNGTLVNLKPISAERVSVIVDQNGLIKRYEVNKQGKAVKYKPAEILHLSNDRVGDEIHGTSVIDACKWVIDARQEAMDVYRKVLKRQQHLGILYIDSDDDTKISEINEKFKDAIKNNEVLVLPQDVAKIENGTVSIADFISWISYLENFFYQAVGIPKIILGGSETVTSDSAKVGYLTFEQVYMAEQRELEQDLWNQVAIKLTFERPVSLKDETVSNEQANTSAVDFQPNDTEVKPGRQ